MNPVASRNRFTQPRESCTPVLEILVEFSHAKTMILVYGRRSRSEIWECFQARKLRIDQNNDFFALKTVRGIQRDCLGTKFWETPTPPPYV